MSCENLTWCADESEISVRMQGVDFVTVRGAPDPREYGYTLECLGTIGPPVARMCDSDTVLRDPTPDCEQGSAIPPRWSRPRGADDDAWLLEALSSCPGDTSYPIAFDDFAVHTYTSVGLATPTLTTRWKGAFQIAGMGEWFEIPGTAETSSSVGELRIYAPRPRLVDDPLT